MDWMKRAYEIIKRWKGDSYVHGLGVLEQVGDVTAPLGRRALVVSNESYRNTLVVETIASLSQAGVESVGIVDGVRPNTPLEDVVRLGAKIERSEADVLVVIGAGSTIDGAKAANVLASLGGSVDQYFGTGRVSETLTTSGKSLIPMVAIQTSSSSAAHLTKYSNVTDFASGQKKLIVDDAITPTVALFDYRTTLSMPRAVTVAGALDTIAHTFEVFMGASKKTYELTAEIAECAIRLVVAYTPLLVDDLESERAREALGLASDLGGYAIMVGGTSGAHLTSFSLVDIASHGTACGLMNPYYAVLFSKAIEDQLRLIAPIFGVTDSADLTLGELAIATAEAMMAFNRSIGSPTRLDELDGFSEKHITRALTAAKDPQLEMKLANMPIPMTAGDVDRYMAAVLESATRGDLSLIEIMEPPTQEAR